MAEGVQRLDPLQRERLQAMGFELLVLRRGGANGTGAAAPAATAAAVTAASGPPEPARARLQVRGADPAAGDRLFAALLRTLGVPVEAVVVARDDRLPVLAFGSQIDAGVHDVRAPALAALRRADAKRALWPALRRLRRQLRERGHDQG